MTLYTRCILSPRDEKEGLRISVMSRHTLQDGVTPDERITLDQYDGWNRVLSPRPKLVGSWYRKEISWDDFAKRYLEYLHEQVISYHVETLAHRASNFDITLLCIEPSAEYCHRRLLAEECKWHYPDLRVIHR